MGQRAWAKRAVVVAAAWVLCTGCSAGLAPEEQARLDALEADAQAMDVALDTVEERLLGSQAMVQTWQELGRRHQQVTEIHCRHADRNMMVLLQQMERQTEKARGLKRRRVASAVFTSGVSGRGGRISQN